MTSQTPFESVQFRTWTPHLSPDTWVDALQAFLKTAKTMAKDPRHAQNHETLPLAKAAFTLLQHRRDGLTPKHTPKHTPASTPETLLITTRHRLTHNTGTDEDFRALCTAVVQVLQHHLTQMKPTETETVAATHILLWMNARMNVSKRQAHRIA